MKNKNQRLACIDIGSNAINIDSIEYQQKKEKFLLNWILLKESQLG